MKNSLYLLPFVAVGVADWYIPDFEQYIPTLMYVTATLLGMVLIRRVYGRVEVPAVASSVTEIPLYGDVPSEIPSGSFNVYSEDHGAFDKLSAELVTSIHRGRGRPKGSRNKVSRKHS